MHVAHRSAPRRRAARARTWAATAAVVAGALAVTATPAAATPVAAGATAPAEGAPVAPGFGEPGIPVRPASERYVREAFEGVLHRTVGEPGLTFWGDALDTTMGRGTFATHLTSSPESLRRQLREAYDVLGRAPTSTELATDLAAVRSRQRTVDAVLVRLLASDEFFEGEGGDSPAGFVQALYNQVLDRAPDEAGAAYWLDRLQSGASRGTVARGFVFSVPRLGAIVDDAYDRVLARAADAAGRAHWVRQMRAGQGRRDVERGLLASGEAWNGGCSTLDPTRCLLPFPNDELTLPDATTDTGRRVVLKPGWVPAPAGEQFDPTEWNRQDGFSPGSAILLHSAGIDPERSDLPGLDDIGASLDADAPIVVVDTTDGTRWPIWAELDANAPDDAERALVIRPARNLLDGHTYAVGVGGVVDADGDPVPAPAGFRTFRDNLPSGDRSVEEERVRVEAAIEHVVAAGLERSSLHMAWTFTVASTRNLAERIVHMRDEALGGPDGWTAPEFTVTSTTPEGDGTTRVDGTYEVPLYLTGDGGPGERLNLGPDDLPEQNGTWTAPFTCTVPDTARTDPARAALYGHGLLGRGTQARSGYVRAVAREHNVVFCGTDYIGMSDEDLTGGLITGLLADLSSFPGLADRNQQGLLNFMVLGRLMTLADGLITHAAFQGDGGAPAIDGSDLSYYGLSQGGIMGGALVAVSPDITRGVLGVPGMNYSTLLHRSVDFDPFFGILAAGLPSALDRITMLSVIQMLWDRGEGNGYANHMTADPLPGTPASEVLLQVAFGDHQVAMAAADVQARTYGAATNDPPYGVGRTDDVVPLWGIDRIEEWPHEGSAIIYWDSGTPAPPYENVPPRPPEHGEDPHGDPRNDPDARRQISEFLRPGGVVVDVCGGDACLVDFA